MQGRRDLSFFPTKKNPAPAGNDDGRLIPAAKESLIYLSIALVSGADREKNRLLEGGSAREEVNSTVIWTMWRRQRRGPDVKNLLKIQLILRNS